MKINTKSLCSSCLYKASCILTSNKNFIWSCSEFEEKLEDNNNQNSILAPHFSNAKSEEEVYTI